jgi:hypothetical protein
VSLFGTVAGPNSKSRLLIEEWSPLEPGVLDHKMYVRGIGTVLEQIEKAATSATNSCPSRGRRETRQAHDTHVVRLGK